MWPSCEFVHRQLTVVIHVECIEMLSAARTHHRRTCMQVSHARLAPGAHFATKQHASPQRVRRPRSSKPARAELTHREASITIVVAILKYSVKIGVIMKVGTVFVLRHATITVVVKCGEVVRAAGVHNG
jgi:hypothetical protein